jgi:carbamoyl-phosphate synthase small subunit
LALADGTVFRGTSFGQARALSHAAVGEMVFNTSMFGYQEILTDPSYAGQSVCFTYPLIGNVGCNPDDDESSRVHATGVLIKELSPTVSNFRATESLDAYLARHGVMGISGIDTRALVSHLRDKGAQMGAMACVSPDELGELIRVAQSAPGMEGRDLVQEVSCREPYTWHELPWSLAHYQKHGVGFPRVADQELSARPSLIAIDCGVKRSILRLLTGAGFRVTVVPCTFSVAEILELKPDALFLSNGPGDPATLTHLVEVVKSLTGRLPIFGICLGHQIIAQSFGASTYKMKFGHRGGNHPVMDLGTKSVEITVQNHGFAVDRTHLSKAARVSHVNLNDDTVEGLEAADGSVFCVQYHPEASPGPHDSRYLFRRFYERVAGAV